MNWEDDLRATARDMGRRLEQGHVRPPARRRVRAWVPAAAVLLLAGAVLLALPRDPAASIERSYAGQFPAIRIEDPALRLEFETALAHVDRAIVLAKDAVRRSPDEPAFADLCHLAFQAKVRLIRAYSQGG